MTEKIIIDAKNAVLGRLAAYATKQALLGKSIVILNCSDVIITGRKKSILHEYTEKRQRGGASLKGPFFPKDSERIVKRTIRGMLPYRQQRGLTALKNIKCYNSIPKEYESSEKTSFLKKIKTNSLSLKEVSKRL